MPASFEDRLKVTSAFALIGGVRVEDFRLARDGVNADGTIPDGQPFTKTWAPVSYRAAYTYEPIHNLMFYSMYATAYDPAIAGVFSLNPDNGPLSLTSARTYETGAKQILWDGKAEWTVAAYDILQKQRPTCRSVRRWTILPVRSPPRALKSPAPCVRLKA